MTINEKEKELLVKYGRIMKEYGPQSIPAENFLIDYLSYNDEIQKWAKAVRLMGLIDNKIKGKNADNESEFLQADDENSLAQNILEESKIRMKYFSAKLSKKDREYLKPKINAYENLMKNHGVYSKKAGDLLEKYRDDLPFQALAKELRFYELEDFKTGYLDALEPHPPFGPIEDKSLYEQESSIVDIVIKEINKLKKK